MSVRFRFNSSVEQRKFRGRGISVGIIRSTNKFLFSFPFTLKNCSQEVLSVPFPYVSLEPRDDPVNEVPSALSRRPQSPTFIPLSVQCAELEREAGASASPSTPRGTKTPFLGWEEGLLWRQSLKSPSTVMVKITSTTTAMLTRMKTTVEEESKAWGTVEGDVELNLEITLAEEVMAACDLA